MADHSLQTVLIVEDDPSIREILQECLESEGFATLQAENGKIGIEQLEGPIKPCAIILDMMMPVMNGREFLDIVQKNDLYRAVPIIVISASASSAQALGARAFIPKPIDFQNLVQKIREFTAEA